MVWDYLTIPPLPQVAALSRSLLMISEESTIFVGSNCWSVYWVWVISHFVKPSTTVPENWNTPPSPTSDCWWAPVPTECLVGCTLKKKPRFSYSSFRPTVYITFLLCTGIRMVNQLCGWRFRQESNIYDETRRQAIYAPPKPCWLIWPHSTLSITVRMDWNRLHNAFIGTQFVCCTLWKLTDIR